MNTAVYTTEIEKIYFTLSLMTEGTPGQWAQNFVDKVEAQAVAGAIPDAAWGTWEQFTAALKKSFADPNKKRTSNYALDELMFSPGQTADEFLQEFETLAGRAGYMGANQEDSRLIVLLEKKVPLRILNPIYRDVIPDTYADYKDKILRYDDLNQKLEALKPKAKGKLRFTSHSGTTYIAAPTGIKIEPAEIQRNRPKSKKLWTPRSSTNKPSTSKPSTNKKLDLSNITCYGCGRKGHMVADCRDKKGKEKGQQLRAFVEDLDEVEKKTMMDFLRV
jgi:Retrotransposon gag protein